MEGNKYLRLKLDGEELDFDVSSDFPISFDYQLEDVQDFQKKKSSESLAIKLPATLNNQRKLNGFHNTSVEDTSVGKYFRSIRKFVAETGGIEIFVGKAIPKRAYKKNGKPTSYELNAFGNNADWLIDMKDVTLYDILKRIEFDFSKQNIINSWGFDGRNENLPYVFAPVKYAGPLDPEARNDKNYHVLSMKPSISKFWTIYWAFQMLGYRVKSDFLDTDYYRRQVMPWTWGAFLTSEGTKYDIHKFRARSTEVRFFDGGINEYVDLN
uniref:hypothetical protein n=1 Tax=Soonwooa sp. TaxID=1938592 RepID=UPI0028B181FA